MSAVVPDENGPFPLSTAHVGTASDFIMRTLIMDFREHTKKKLDAILKFGVVRFSIWPFLLYLLLLHTVIYGANTDHFLLLLGF